MASSSSSSSSSSVFLLLLSLLLLLGLATTSSAKKSVVLTYYTQQQFGVNEFSMVPAAVAPANGTRQGVGLEVVYDYTVTAGGSPTTSAAIGFVRGTSVVVSNTAQATIFFVKTVVEIADPVSGLSGTFSTQGEANFASGQPFELAVVGGTEDFRGVTGYAIATSFNFTPPTSTSTAKVTNAYQAFLTFLL